MAASNDQSKPSRRFGLGKHSLVRPNLRDVVLAPFAQLWESSTGVVARVEGLRGRNSAFEPREAGRQVDGLFESLLSESFGGGA